MWFYFEMQHFSGPSKGVDFGFKDSNIFESRPLAQVAISQPVIVVNVDLLSLFSLQFFLSTTTRLFTDSQE